LQPLPLAAASQAKKKNKMGKTILAFFSYCIIDPNCFGIY
jgi:hypothetical protein